MVMMMAMTPSPPARLRYRHACAQLGEALGHAWHGRGSPALNQRAVGIEAVDHYRSLFPFVGPRIPQSCVRRATWKRNADREAPLRAHRPAPSARDLERDNDRCR